ncbi:hypothetical protein [Kurthia huakuii]|uniref:hypothetical protein n=1 Tax=Kurthia huakuii TaxID=1421019 RepID=UPI000495757E|nr:hypothetical protein [Kurthia huakuii]MBM7699523.1 hypothetical protein [Kurthia huakuii]
MGIDRYLTFREAVDRWQITDYKLNQKLSNKVIIERALDEKMVKRYQRDGEKRIYWIISVKFMEKWFGLEPAI